MAPTTVAPTTVATDHGGPDHGRRPTTLAPTQVAPTTAHADERRPGNVLTAIRRVPVNAVSCPQQGTGKKEKRPS